MWKVLRPLTYSKSLGEIALELKTLKLTPIKGVLLLFLLILSDPIMQQAFREWVKLVCGFGLKKWNNFLASHTLASETFWVPIPDPWVQKQWQNWLRLSPLTLTKGYKNLMQHWSAHFLCCFQGRFLSLPFPPRYWMTGMKDDLLFLLIFFEWGLSIIWNEIF